MLIKRKNKHTSVVLSSLVLLAAVPQGAMAQSINCVQPLIFGGISTCGAAGTVTVHPDNSKTVGSCLSASGAPHSRARCLLSQSFPTRPIKISLTPATVTMNIATGTATMKMTGFNIITNANGPSATKTGLFVNVPIGATMNIGATQVHGVYSGTFTLNAVLQ